MSKERDVADRTLTGGGCQRNGAEGNYLCPVNGMLGLCQTMMKNSAVLSCGALIPTSTDQILRRGGCSEEGQTGTYECPSGMMGLCAALREEQGRGFVQAEVTVSGVCGRLGEQWAAHGFTAPLFS